MHIYIFLQSNKVAAKIVFSWIELTTNSVTVQQQQHDKLYLHDYRVFSHDVTAAILVSQNNETAAMLVSQTNPLGVELFSYANTFFCSNEFA